MKSRSQVIKLLETKYPKMSLRTTEDFNGTEGGIWTSGEDHLPAKDGHSLFNYYSENYTRYSLGVHEEIYSLLEKHGWYAEWHDAGTIMLWPD
jgi:hypothetical protein